MPPLPIPPDLKRLTPFLRRAEELDRDKTHPESRLVAYYCRQHAVRVGIKLSTTAADRECLGEVLNALEKEKAAMSVFSTAESYGICKGLAERVFERAEGELQGGVADKGTARTFYAAATFLEILTQFHEAEEEHPDEDEKRVYAKWKATEILKAIKEGREITPDGYDATPNPSLAPDTDNDILPPPAPFAPAPFPAAPVDDSHGTEVDIRGTPQEMPPSYNNSLSSLSAPPPPMIPPPMIPPPSYNDSLSSLSAPPPFRATTPVAPSGGRHVGKEKLEDAIELTRFALAALEDRDVELGVTRLRMALARVTE